MHAIYAHRNDAFETVDKAEKFLIDSLNNAYQLYIFNLYMITEVIQHVEEEIERLETNYIQKDDDFLITDKLLKSNVVQSVLKGNQLEVIMNKEKIKPIVDDNGIIDVYQKFKKSDKFKEYVLNEDATDRDAFDLIKYLYYDFMMQHDVIEHYLEENWISWQDDREFIASSVVKTLKGFANGKEDLLVPFQGNWSADATFIKDLLKNTIYDFEENDALIKEFAKNWEVERITMIDRLLMHMGICEFIHIDSVPAKVSIDEYIELSKIYSTPKSKSFINGVLDKVLHRLKKEGKVNKD